MANNQIITPSIFTKETLTLIENNLVFAGRVTRQFENQFVKIGSKLNIRKPVKLTVSKGPALQIQDIVEPSVDITIDQQAHADFDFETSALTLAIEEFSERYVRPAAAVIVNDIDSSLAALYSDIHNLAGTPGTTPSTYLGSVAAVGLYLDNEAAPQDGRTLVLGPAAYWSITDTIKNAYVQSVAEPAFKGLLANIANFSIYMDQNVRMHTVGNYGGTPTVSGANQTGSTLVTAGWTAAGTLKEGDVFTIAGVFSVNPVSKQSTGVLRNFVVTADTTLTAAACNIPISPPITVSGPYATVTGSPANAAAITVRSGAANGVYPQNIAFTKEAFGLVTVPLDIPGGTDFAAREMYRDISLRVIRDYIINTDTKATRCDVLYGVKTFYPEFACRLTG